MFFRNRDSVIKIFVLDIRDYQLCQFIIVFTLFYLTVINALNQARKGL